MDTNSQQAAGGPPVKPWEQADTSSGPTPFKPPSSGSTSSVVEASGTARPGEIVSTADRNTAINRNALTRPVPNRPWEQQQNYGSTYGGYNSDLNYNSGMYGSSYGGLGGGLGGSYVLKNNQRMQLLLLKQKLAYENTNQSSNLQSKK